MLISDAYKQLNAELHARSPSYGTSGHKWAPLVDSLARQCGARSVLDYGCGRGTLVTALFNQFADERNRDGGGHQVPFPYDFIEYDPAIEGKTKKPSHADLVVCGDVLEHIEPDCLYAVLDDIRNIARLGVFLVVATRPAKKTLADGRNAHLIVEPSHWWLPKINDRWRIDSFKDYGPMFMCVGMAR